MALEEITDFVSEEVIPCLIHFSKKGIVPKILGVDNGALVRMKPAQGPRLFHLMGSASQENLIKVYNQLGVNTAYVNKYGISHGHLHTLNIIIEGGKPVIIDWKMAGNYGFFGGDDEYLLDDTRKILDEIHRAEIYTALSNSFTTAFELEKEVPLEVSYSEIQQIAWREFGVC